MNRGIESYHRRATVRSALRTREVGPGMAAELLRQAAAVGLDRPQADAEAPGDLGVGVACHEERQNLLLPGRQGGDLTRAIPAGSTPSDG